MPRLSAVLGTTFQGSVGPQGNAATLAVGSTTVLNANQNPNVVNSGNTFNGILTFSLPRAPNVFVGTVSTTTEGGSAQVTPSYSSGDVTLNFTLPRGNTAGFDTANAAFLHANSAFARANLDFTSVFLTTATHGTSIAIPVFTLTSNGRISAVTNTTIRSATTGQTGVVSLSTSIASTSTTEAATPSAVKTAYDLALSANTNATSKASTGKAIAMAIVFG
jgi:hypothetical protein